MKSKRQKNKKALPVNTLGGVLQNMHKKNKKKIRKLKGRIRDLDSLHSAFINRIGKILDPENEDAMETISEIHNALEDAIWEMSDGE